MSKVQVYKQLLSSCTEREDKHKCTTSILMSCS